MIIVWNCALGGEKHEIVFVFQNVGPDCEDVGGYGVTVDEKLEILDVHNWYRRVVAGGYETTGAGGPQPKGANIMKLVRCYFLANIRR